MVICWFRIAQHQQPVSLFFLASTTQSSRHTSFFYKSYSSTVSPICCWWPFVGRWPQMSADRHWPLVQWSITIRFIPWLLIRPTTTTTTTSLTHILLMIHEQVVYTTVRHHHLLSGSSCGATTSRAGDDSSRLMMHRGHGSSRLTAAGSEQFADSLSLK
jgi:hypothetical protein